MGILGVTDFFTSPVSAAPTCTIYWTGASGTAWNIGSDWSLTDGGPKAGRLPTGADYVCMSTAPVNQSVTLNTNATVGGINWPATATVTPTLTMAAYNLTLKTTADPSTVDRFVLSGGSLAGPATLTVTGTLGLNGTNSNALTGAHLINKGVATETGDYIGLNNSSVLENAGTLNLTDGFEIFSNDTTANQLENDASGTINYTSTAAASTQISVATVNAGMLTLGGNSTLDVDGPSFDNSGTGTVNAGGTTTFSAEAGNSVSNVDAGTYSVASGAAVDSRGGTRTIGAATFTGTGPVHVSASLDVADPVSIPNLQLDSGSLAGPATLSRDRHPRAQRPRIPTPSPAPI